MPPTGGGVALAPLPKKEWEEFFFDHMCLHGILSLSCLMLWRVVSLGWREKIHKSLPLLRGVSFHVCVTGEDVLRALGLIAGGKLQVVGLALCRGLSARDIEKILKLLDATCPGVREVDITACSDEVILRALSVRALSTLGASPLHVHARLLELAAGTARCPFDAFLNALEAPRLLFDPAFAHLLQIQTHLTGSGAFLKVAAKACIAGNETAVMEAALLLGLAFPVGNQGETRVFDCNQRDLIGQTALHFVAQRGCPAPLFAVLRSAGAVVDATDTDRNTPLLIASMRGLCGVVELLLAAGADVAVKNKWGKTALDVATNDEVKAALRQHGAKHSLFHAAEVGMLELVADLIKEGADVNEKNKDGMTALALACVKLGNMEKLSWGGASADEAPHGLAVGRWVSATVTFTSNRWNAVPKGALGKVASFDQNGNAFIDFEDLHNLHHLHRLDAQQCVLKSNFGNMSVLSQEDVLKERAQREEVVAMLIATAPTQAAGALNEANNEGVTPLMHASMRGLCGVVELLLAAGADVATKDKEGNSCLHIAAAQGSNNILRILLNAGANITAKNEWGKTALDVATNDEVQAALRQHGAKHSLFYAAEEGMLRLEQVVDLIKEGADVNEHNKSSWTALHYAARNGHHAVAQALLGAGADINAKTSGGWTPLTWARARGRREVEALLRQHGAE